ncbi:protocadherin Fat 4 [Acyrthosiphon pisum]|uniref:Cadherin domain-containing protein n=1 Tax=Acyrthosiphon pisum TaxID=7029 RepID=A0A8R2A2U0_ACYPI|nr:protocadherin Fat 4 [Acyrthosiphon pisum]XP_029347017.1 protocadherin Fat 4 [Acyrthosiphon pisum]|eukprot:XP_001942850.2 PREDICTED: protocadherin Fat 4 [Acyrthosiphon pisum]
MLTRTKGCLQLVGVLISIWLGHVGSQAVVDNRCYLENGGSAESFFVSEDVPVGSIIGVLKINGDTSETGNINLSLKEVDSPVAILPGTKELSLTKLLDKEGISGPSSVYVNVICERKHTADPNFAIPVSIRVTDANDNAPIFVNAPYVLNISEVTVVGTRVLQGIKAVDADQLGPFSTVHYTVLPGPHSDFFVFVNGLEGTLVLRKALDYETLSNFTIGIRAQDQGNPPQYTDTVIFVNIIDADDQNPKFYDERYTATLPDNAAKGTKLRVFPREIAAYDQDLGINANIFYTLNSDTQDSRYFELDRVSGSVTVKRAIPEDDLLQPVTMVIRATQFDNADRYALATLAISRPGTSLRELQFLQDHYQAGVLENVPLDSVLLTVITNKPKDKRLKYWLSNYTDIFSISINGDIVLKKPLDYETIDNYVFYAFATDSFMNTSAFVNITVLNVNDWDPRFRYPQYEFYVPDISLSQLLPGTVIGKVEAADGDRGDRVTLALRGPESRMFAIEDSGDIVLGDLSDLNTSTAHLVAVATDTGIPPRQASVPVIVHLPDTVVRFAGRTSANSYTVFVIFGVILGVLSLVIIALIVHIQKNKRPKLGTATNFDVRTKFEGFKRTNPIYDEKRLVGVGTKMQNPLFNPKEDSADPLYTATVKTTRMFPGTTNGNGRAKMGAVQQTLPRSRHKFPAPAPPQVPRGGGGGGRSPAGSSTTTTTATPSPVSRFSRMPHWPTEAIPKRVKKLSWDDRNSCAHMTREIDPSVSVTPVEETRREDNLTVYF